MLQRTSSIYNCLGKRVRKRRRKKKRPESPEKLNNQQPKILPIEIIEQNQKQQTQFVEHPKIEIVPANSDLRVDEIEWIKQNEALLIAELETRRQAGLPIQVLVRVEKITPSMPEYCQIIPDFCHLDVIKEETSASDEDRKREVWECSEKIKEANNFKILPDDWKGSDVDEETNCKLGFSELNLNETITSKCHLERLKSPSLVKESEDLKFADIVTSTENEMEQLEPLTNLSLDLDNKIKNIPSVKQEALSISNNKLNNEKLQNNSTYMEDIKADIKLLQKDNSETENMSNNKIENYNHEHNNLIPNALLTTNSEENNIYEEIVYQKNSPEVHTKDKKNHHLKVYNTKSQLVNNSCLIEPTYAAKIKEYEVCSLDENRSKKIEGFHQENVELEMSSDESTLKQFESYSNKYKTRNKNKVSIKDKLKHIAKLLQDDTDDYEDIQSSQTTSRCVSIVSDADVDTDWVSFTLSDGESSKSLCLSPSQLKSGNAPSTVTETSEIIDLHKKFLNRTRSPNLSPYQDTTSVEILSFSNSPSPSKSYSSDVFDEACRMCGTSDEPLSDAECLVSLRKYRETRSRLLDLIQQEQRLNRSVIDRPSPMPAFIDTLSVPDNHTRELMYTEYMEKVKERENRLNNKVIRITKSSRPLSSGTLQALNDIDAEFVTKARERLEKMGVETDIDIEVQEEYYPKHLEDIVPEEEVCIEEVQMNGESSGLSVYVFVLFGFTNTVFAVWPSLITLLQ